MGGSSTAAVALISEFSKVLEEMGQGALSRKNIALLAQKLEASVAGVPCGLQDQLAAAYGGANIWYWPVNDQDPFFRKKTVIRKQYLREFERQLLLGYCGVPHESKNVNLKWVQQFLS
mgnify:FL=1